MLFSIPAILVPLLATLAYGAALPTPEDDISVKAVTTMTAYTGTYRSGSSKSWTLTTQTECVRLSGTDWNDVISSIVVQSGHRCRLWSSNNCDGDSTPDIYSPGADELPSGMNDKTTSFKCYVN